MSCPFEHSEQRDPRPLANEANLFHAFMEQHECKVERRRKTAGVTRCPDEEFELPYHHIRGSAAFAHVTRAVEPIASLTNVTEFIFGVTLKSMNPLMKT